MLVGIESLGCLVHVEIGEVRRRGVVERTAQLLLLMLLLLFMISVRCFPRSTDSAACVARNGVAGAEVLRRGRNGHQTGVPCWRCELLLLGRRGGKADLRELPAVMPSALSID